MPGVGRMRVPQEQQQWWSQSECEPSLSHCHCWASLVVQMVKNLPTTWETWVQSLGWEDFPGEGHGDPLQYSFLENPCGQRSLAGYSLWSCKELETVERLSTNTVTQEKHSSLRFRNYDFNSYSELAYKSLT